ncbi:MAG TPA: MlaD family protein [Frankiaceae bacterium]|nr:MlaD family protein [Frankiaceae bacterium]
MIRRTVKIQLAAFVVIFVLGILYAGFSLVGLDAIRRPYTVTADFAASGGIFTGAEVTYRGVRVGSVGAMRLTHDGVLVDLKIDRDKQIPADGITATVANKSAVGEQYVDLRPATAGDPFLENGDRIDRAHTRLPVDISKVLVDLDRLVNSIDRENLKLLVGELGTAFRGTGPAITELIDAGNDLTDAMREVLPETIQLIEEGEQVLRTANVTAPQFREFTRGLADLTETLRTSDPDIRRLFANGVRAAAELEGLIEPNQQALAVLLGDLVTINRIGVARLSGTRQTMLALPELVKRVPLALVDGQLRNGLVVHDNPVSCTYDTENKAPRVRKGGPADTTQNCHPTEGGKRTSCWAQPSDEMRRCLNQSPAADGPVPVPVAPAALGTGSGPYTLASDGSLATVGWEGGQQAVLGEHAWLGLLLAPLQ